MSAELMVHEILTTEGARDVKLRSLQSYTFIRVLKRSGVWGNLSATAGDLQEAL